MSERRIRHLLILGGGTAGWMTAALLSKLFRDTLNITLVESDDIATVGVGEATIPPIQVYNDALKIDEGEFLRATKGTIKLGIEFAGWGEADSRYIHAFGGIGHHHGLSPFVHYFLRAHAAGANETLWDYSLNARAAYAGKFAPLSRIEGTPLAGLNYAYHFDAGLYARFLRELAEAQGVTRREGKVTSARQDSESGFVTAIEMEDGTAIDADFFVDCSGFRALLIEGAMESGTVDYSHWLPCDRAVAVPTENVGAPRPYTQSIAHKAGWQWRIPLQHRTGNGHVFSSEFMSEDEATQIVLDHIEGEPIAEPRTIRFRTGRRKDFWRGNVVAIGLSSGFLEPLESTSIHLIQQGAVKLATLFPDGQFDPSFAAEYNRQMADEFDLIRDFIILHYHANRRDEPLWRTCREMDVPESLTRRIELFRASGRIFREQNELFHEVGWLQVMIGQGIWPERYDQMADALPKKDLDEFLANLRTIIGGVVNRMPTHQDFLDRLESAAA